MKFTIKGKEPLVPEKPVVVELRINSTAEGEYLTLKLDGYNVLNITNDGKLELIGGCTFANKLQTDRCGRILLKE